MSGRGVTLKINRAETIRLLGSIMRDKKARFDAEKKEFGPAFRMAKQEVLAALKQRMTLVHAADSVDRLCKLATDDPIEYSRRSGVMPKVPELNVCAEKRVLLMLQQDVREFIPINSNHELWAVLQDKCEVLRG